MNRRHKRKGCLIALLVALALLALLAWVVLRSPLQRASEVAPEILNYVDQSEVMVDPVRDRETPYGDVQLYAAELQNGDEVLFDVDEGGDVVGFFQKGVFSPETYLSFTEATQIALHYAREHYTNDDILDVPPHSAELVDTQPHRRYYRFYWAGRDAQSDAVLPQSVVVDVSATSGAVIGYSQIDAPVDVDTLPKIEQSAAEKIVLDAIEAYLEDPSVIETTLIVAPPSFVEEGSAQALLWQVVVGAQSDQGSVSPVCVVFVDAVTGQAVRIEPLW